MSWDLFSGDDDAEATDAPEDEAGSAAGEGSGRIPPGRRTRGPRPRTRGSAEPAPYRGPPPSAPGGDPEHALSPSAVNELVRELLEGGFPSLWVSGEVTGWKRHGSGHRYFSLRDARAQLRCVMFASDARSLPTDPEEGMRLRALGTLTLYERRGEFQLRVRKLEAEGGDGLWRLAFERLRAKLEAEGLLAAERKRALPPHPARVGVVTSPVGAALHDILRVIRARAPWTRVVLSPARVQGEGAASEIARAIRLFAQTDAADVLIVGRGGGSSADLWAFNEEPVARAIAESPVPVVSAVGHEVDVTLADLVADLRAPTPSGAAELVVPDRVALARQLVAVGDRLGGALERSLALWRRDLEGRAADLAAAVDRGLRDRRERLLRSAGKLEALSPLAALRRGYAVPVGEAGRVLRRVADFAQGSAFDLRVQDGRVGCRVDSARPEEEP